MSGTKDEVSWRSSSRTSTHARTDAEARMARALEAQRRTREHLERALHTAAETEELAHATLGELATQRETLERTHDKVKEVQHMNATSKWLLRGMSSFSGRIRNMFSSPPARPDGKGKGKGKAAPKGSAAATGRRASAPAIGARGGGGGGGGAAGSSGGAGRGSSGGTGRGAGGGGGWESRHTGRGRGGSGAGGGKAGSTASSSGGAGGGGGGGSGQSTALRDSREVENALADELGKSVARLKVIAQTTGEELDGQNRMLDDIERDVDKAHAGMRANNRRARRIT